MPEPERIRRWSIGRAQATLGSKPVANANSIRKGRPWEPAITRKGRQEGVFFFEALARPGIEPISVVGQHIDGKDANVDVDPRHIERETGDQRWHDRSVANRHVVHGVNVVAKPDHRRHEAFGPWDEDMLRRCQSARLRKGLSGPMLLRRAPSPLEKRHQEHGNLLGAKLRKHALNSGPITRPIPLDEEAIEELHAPTKARKPLHHILHKPFHVAHAPTAPSKTHQREHISHRLVIGQNERILTRSGRIAGEANIDAILDLGHHDPKSPDRTCTPTIDGAEGTTREGI